MQQQWCVQLIQFLALRQMSESSSSSKAKAEILDRINEEIAMVRQQGNIKQIAKVDDYMYTITYCPSSTKSPYRQRNYTLEVTLPETYPTDPPSIRFLDQIYHLNVGFRSGEVRMPVLEDDWSPFLSLTSVIESLDRILEEPELEYALEEETLGLYQYDRQTYNKNVQDNVSLVDVILCESAERRDSPPYSDSPIKKLNGQNYKLLTNRNGKEKPEVLVRNLRQSMELAEERKASNQNLNHDVQRQRGDVPPIIKSESVQQLKFSENKIEQYTGSSGEAMEAIQVKLSDPSRASRLKIAQDQPKSLGGDYRNLTLQKISNLIRCFIEELDEMEVQLKDIKNQAVKALMIERHDAQLEMLRELVILSEETKRKIMRNLKEEVSKL